VVGKVAVDSSNHSLEFSDVNYRSAERTTAALCSNLLFSVPSIYHLVHVLYKCTEYAWQTFPPSKVF